MPETPPTLAIDYAGARPNPHAIRAAGYAGVMRYLSYSAWKNLGHAERAALHAAGLWIGLVWETTADRAKAGRAAGEEDARAANLQADQLGYPDRCVIFYAVDFDAQPGQVAHYFSGVRDASKRPVGVYGGLAIVQAHLAPYRWQTVAWSHGQLLESTHLYQRLHPSHPIAGTPDGYDENVVIHDLPVWHPAGAKTKPAPKTRDDSKAAHPASRGRRVDDMIDLEHQAEAHTHNPGRLHKLRTALAALLSINPVNRD